MIHRTTSKAAVLVSSIALLALMAIALTTVTKRVSAATFTVTNLDDSGDGSLRQAILDANANPGADFIDFQDELTGTITLTSGELLVTDDLTINGPGIFAITVSGNNASRVFEIIQTTSVTISGLTISDGKSQGTSGGGIIHSSGTLTISNVLLTRNTADISGGGIDNLINSTLIVTNSTLSANSSSRVGGGIQNDGTLKITNSTLSGNTAGFTGGGIGNDHGDLTITNSTVSGNSASSSGGGISNFAFGTANISFTTMSGNSAVQGGGIYNAGDPNLSTVNIKNSIVANSTSGGDCSNSGTFNPTGTNFTTNGTCPGFTQVTPAQLNLGPLADNGGPTQTHALLPGSVAIDAVPDCTDVGGSTVGTDQRGVGRPQGSACDVGAYEFVPCNQTPAIICPESFSVSTDPDKCAAVVEFSPQADCPC